MAAANFSERLNTVVELLMETSLFANRQDVEMAARAYQSMLNMGDKYKPTAVYPGDIILIRARTHTLESGNLTDDYNLHEVCLKFQHAYLMFQNVTLSSVILLIMFSITS